MCTETNSFKSGILYCIIFHVYNIQVDHWKAWHAALNNDCLTFKMKLFFHFSGQIQSNKMTLIQQLIAKTPFCPQVWRQYIKMWSKTHIGEGEEIPCTTGLISGFKGRSFSCQTTSKFTAKVIFFFVSDCYQVFHKSWYFHKPSS